MADGSGLTGTYRVRVFRPALDRAHKLFRKCRDAMELRSHALKLRYWPLNHPTDESGNVLDLNWSWIQSLKGQSVGELRIDDAIGGHENLRVIFLGGRRIAARTHAAHLDTGCHGQETKRIHGQ